MPFERHHADYLLSVRMKSVLLSLPRPSLAPSSAIPSLFHWFHEKGRVRSGANGGYLHVEDSSHSSGVSLQSKMRA